MVRNLNGKARRHLSVVSVITVLVLLVATLGIPLNQHLCGGKVFSQDIYGAAKQCAMIPERIPAGAVALATQSCCNDRHELQAASGLENDGPSVVSIGSEYSPDQNILVKITNWAPSTRVDRVLRGNTSPPLIDKDVVLEYRVLLI